jgi:hypothetical protein
MADSPALTKSDLQEALTQLETQLGQKFATKDDLNNLATRDDLLAMGARLEDYVQDAAHTVL